MSVQYRSHVWSKLLIIIDDAGCDYPALFTSFSAFSIAGQEKVLDLAEDPNISDSLFFHIKLQTLLTECDRDSHLDHLLLTVVNKRNALFVSLDVPRRGFIGMRDDVRRG